MKSKIKKFKTAFSMAEVALALLLVAIFAAFSAPIITKKKVKPVSKSFHGKYECYIENSQLYQKTTSDTSQGTAQVVSECSFKPDKKAAYYILQAVGGGGGGSSAFDGLNGEAGEFNSLFVNSLTKILTISLGEGGNQANSAEAGKNTIVGFKDDLGNIKPVLEAKGGRGGLSQSIQGSNSYEQISGYDEYMNTSGYSAETTNYGNGGSGLKSGSVSNGHNGTVSIIW